jgi:hypothetical protein
MWRAAHIRDTSGNPNPCSDRLNSALAQRLAVPSEEDALLVWLFGLAIET